VVRPGCYGKYVVADESRYHGGHHPLCFVTQAQHPEIVVADGINITRLVNSEGMTLSSENLVNHGPNVDQALNTLW
jgi:hypothetical protein